MKLTVVIPTYNEKDNLPKMAAALFALPVSELHLLVVDDNSPDGTGQLAEALSEKYNGRISVLHRQGKLGLGTATIAALQFAMDNNYDYVLNMDADFSHHPRYIPDLLEGIEQNDVVIGSRYVPGGGVAGWPLSRRLMSRAINLYARVLLGIPARDTSGAFRCFRVDALARIEFDRIISRGYSFQEEFLYASPGTL